MKMVSKAARALDGFFCERLNTSGRAQEVNYAAVIDRYNREQVITDDMIHNACCALELAQGYPFAARLRGDE